MAKPLPDISLDGPPFQQKRRGGPYPGLGRRGGDKDGQRREVEQGHLAAPHARTITLIPNAFLVSCPTSTKLK